MGIIMRNEVINFIEDTPNLTHAAFSNSAGEVSRVVLEIRDGDWAPELMSYVLSVGNTLAVAGFKFRTEESSAERWMRFVFVAPRRNEGGADEPSPTA